MLVIVVVAAAVAVCGCGGGHASTAPAQARRALPGGIVGAMFDGPVMTDAVDLNRQLDLAVASGVESLRVTVYWSVAQPYRSFAQIPTPVRSEFVDVGGVPTRFGAIDRIVGAAADRGVTVLPVVLGAPGWDAVAPRNYASSPRSPAPYAAFLTALVKRYGPDGSFWAHRSGARRMPVRMWQIWNEPSFTSYWSEQPFAPSYVRLLRAAHAAIKAADPGGKVVLAGFADFSWRYIAQVYAQPGARNLFDFVAVHPYTAQPDGVITILDRVRAVMDRSGDSGKPMLATEITWPSSAGKAPPQFGVSTTERQQAERLNALMPLLIENRARLGLAGFYWYTWMGDETPVQAPDAFEYAGLLKYVSGTISPKPALAVFTRWALAIEHCARKARSAIACA
jgi:hypothetical protein